MQRFYKAIALTVAIATEDEKNCKNQLGSEEMHRIEEVQKLPKYTVQHIQYCSRYWHVFVSVFHSKGYLLPHLWGCVQLLLLFVCLLRVCLFVWMLVAPN